MGNSWRTNPIDTPHTEKKDRYHSDTHILFNKDTGKLEVWYRTVSGKGVQIYRKTSSDGIIWSNRELLKDYSTEKIINAGCVCPVVIYENGKYNIWIYDKNGTEGLGTYVIKYETSDATNWGTPTKCNGIRAIWHFDIVKHNGEYILYSDIRSKSQYLYTSTDGYNWGNETTIMQDDENRVGKVTVELMEKVDEFVKEGKLVAAICAAPSILGHRGHLRGKKACSYPTFESHLEGAEVLKQPAVTDGNIVTGRGMGAAIDFGLAILEKIEGKDVADKMAETIVYANRTACLK